MQNFQNEKTRKNFDLINQTLKGSNAEHFLGKRRKIVSEEVEKQIAEHKYELPNDDPKDENATRRNKYIKIIKKIDESEYSVESLNSRQKNANKSVDITPLKRDNSKDQIKGRSGSTAKLFNNKSSTASLQSKNERSKVTEVANTNTFVSKEVLNSNYIALKHKRRSVGVAEDDLEHQVLDETKAHKKGKDSLHVDNNWINENKFGKDDKLEDLQTKADENLETKHRKLK